MDYWTDEIGLVALCTLKNCFDFENVKRDALVCAVNNDLGMF